MSSTKSNGFSRMTPKLQLTYGNTNGASPTPPTAASSSSAHPSSSTRVDSRSSKVPISSLSSLSSPHLSSGFRFSTSPAANFFSPSKRKPHSFDEEDDEDGRIDAHEDEDDDEDEDERTSFRVKRPKRGDEEHKQAIAPRTMIRTTPCTIDTTMRIQRIDQAQPHPSSSRSSRRHARRYPSDSSPAHARSDTPPPPLIPMEEIRSTESPELPERYQQVNVIPLKFAAGITSNASSSSSSSKRIKIVSPSKPSIDLTLSSDGSSDEQDTGGPDLYARANSEAPILPPMDEMLLNQSPASHSSHSSASSADHHSSTDRRIDDRHTKLATRITTTTKSQRATHPMKDSQPYRNVFETDAKQRESPASSLNQLSCSPLLSPPISPTADASAGVSSHPKQSSLLPADATLSNGRSKPSSSSSNGHPSRHHTSATPSNPSAAPRRSGALWLATNSSIDLTLSGSENDHDDKDAGENEDEDEEEYEFDFRRKRKIATKRRIRATESDDDDESRARESAPSSDHNDEEDDADDDDEVSEASVCEPQLGPRFQAVIPMLLTAEARRVDHDRFEDVPMEWSTDSVRGVILDPSDVELELADSKMQRDRMRADERMAARLARELKRTPYATSTGGSVATSASASVSTASAAAASASAPPKPMKSRDGEAQYFVNAILCKKHEPKATARGKKGRHGGHSTAPAANAGSPSQQAGPTEYLYFVSWEGFPDSENTFEPYGNVRTVLQYMSHDEIAAIPTAEEYQKRHPHAFDAIEDYIKATQPVRHQKARKRGARATNAHDDDEEGEVEEDKFSHEDGEKWMLHPNKSHRRSTHTAAAASSTSSHRSRATPSPSPTIDVVHNEVIIAARVESITPTPPTGTNESATAAASVTIDGQVDDADAEHGDLIVAVNDSPTAVDSRDRPFCINDSIFRIDADEDPKRLTESREPDSEHSFLVQA